MRRPTPNPASRRPIALAAFAGLSALLLATPGCGGDDGRPPRFPASGSVLVDGEPAEGVEVRLHPADRPDDLDAPSPGGTSGPDGSFALGTYEKGGGAPAGRYRATLFWPDRPPGPSPPEDRLGGRYADPDRSDLEVTIAEGENRLDPFEADRPTSPSRRPARRPRALDVDGMSAPPADLP